MYIQITTKCNMTCDHCCFACGTKGEHMKHDVFLRALSLASRLNSLVTIGGGEPTLHPHFYDFMDRAIHELHFNNPYVDEVKNVHIVTNGSIKKRAFYLIDQWERENIDVNLSIDQFHDPISEEVEEAFRERDLVRYVKEEYVKKQGRATSWAWREGCACDTLAVLPNGDVKSCGCLDAPVHFNILDKEEEEVIKWFEKMKETYEEFGFGHCHKDEQQQLKCA